MEKCRYVVAEVYMKASTFKPGESSPEVQLYGVQEDKDLIESTLSKLFDDPKKGCIDALLEIGFEPLSIEIYRLRIPLA